MESYRTTENDVEKEEGELSSSDVDDDQGKANSFSSHSAHTLQVHTESEVILSTVQPNIDEIPQMIVIDEWQIPGVWDKENQAASSNKNNQFTSSNDVNTASNKWNQSSAKYEKNTLDPSYDASRNASVDKNYPRHKQSREGLKRRFSAVEDQAKYGTTSNTACEEVSLLNDAQGEFSSSDQMIMEDRRNGIRRKIAKSGHDSSFGEAAKEAKRLNALYGSKRSRFLKHSSARRQTLNYSTNSQLVRRFHEHRRVRVNESQHFTSPHMNGSAYTTYGDYPSQDSSHCYTPQQSTSHGISAARRTQSLPFNPNNRSNVSPSYLHAEPYQHHPATTLLTEEIISQKLRSMRYGERNHFHDQNNTFSGNIQACESTSTLKSSNFNRQALASTSYYSSKFSTVGCVVSTNIFNHSGPRVDNHSIDIQTGLDAECPRASFSDSTATFCNRSQLFYDCATGRHATNMTTTHVAATSKLVSEGGPNKKINDSIMKKSMTERKSEENQKFHERIYKHCADLKDIKTKINCKSFAEGKSQEKQELRERVNKLSAKIEEMKAKNNCQYRFNIDRTSNAKLQSLNKVYKRAVPEFSEQDNSHNMTPEEKEKTNLLSSVLPQMNKDTAAHVKSSLPDTQSVPREPHAESKGNEMDRGQVVDSSQLRMFEYNRNKQASDKKVTEKNNENRVTSQAETQKDCGRHVTAMESIKINDESHVTGPSKKQETYDGHASVMESTEENDESHVTSLVKAQEDCGRLVTAMESAEENDESHVTSLVKTQEDCGRLVTAMESTEENDESHGTSLVKTQEDCGRLVTAMESAEENDESHVTSLVKTQEDCERYVSVMEITETYDEKHVSIKGEPREDCDNDVTTMKITEGDNRSHVTSPAKTQEDCDKHVTAKQMTKGDDENHGTSPVATKEGSIKHFTAIESSKAENESHVRIIAEVQEDCDKQATSMEST